MRRFPKDRFDVTPRRGERVGVHRSASRRPGGWITIIVSLAVIVVLVGAGFFVVRSKTGLFGIGDAVTPQAASSAPATVKSTKPRTSSAKPTVTSTEPSPRTTVDRSVSTIVLNGTTVAGVAHAAARLLEDGGWKNMRTPVNATQQNVQQTTVYYSGAQNRATAEAAAQVLEGSGALSGRKIPVEASEAYAANGAMITVVIGLDYSRAAG